MKLPILPLIFLHCATSIACAITGIPEPGAIFYGKVTSVGTTTAQNISAFTWTIEDAGTGRKVELSLGNGIELTTKDSEKWYIARVPFQTTAIGGVNLDPLPEGTFALSATPISYRRNIAFVNGSSAAIKSPAEGTVSLPAAGIVPSTHSLLERVDLEISSSFQELYAAWIAAYYPANDPRALPDADPDSDGIMNKMERALGSDPSKPSVVPISSGSVTLNGQNYFTYTYYQPGNVSDAPPIPQLSVDMESWRSGESVLEELDNIPEGAGKRITVRDIIPISPARKAFIRLKVN